MSKVDLDRFIDFMVEYKKEISKDYEEEIEKLNKELNTYKYRPKTRFRDVIELRDRINKAIEYIENNTYKSNATEYMDLTGISELLDILKGVDKE